MVPTSLNTSYRNLKSHREEVGETSWHAIDEKMISAEREAVLVGFMSPVENKGTLPFSLIIVRVNQYSKSNFAKDLH